MTDFSEQRQGPHGTGCTINHVAVTVFSGTQEAMQPLPSKDVHLPPLFLRPQSVPHALSSVPDSLLFSEQICDLLSKSWCLPEASRYAVACSWVHQICCCSKGGDRLLGYRQGTPHWDERPLFLMYLLHLVSTNTADLSCMAGKQCGN